MNPFPPVSPLPLNGGSGVRSSWGVGPDDLQRSREERPRLELENARLLGVVDQLKAAVLAPGRSVSLEDKALLQTLAEAVRDSLSAATAPGNFSTDLEIVRLADLCRSQRRVISGLLQKQQGVFSDTAISQIWKIVELLGLQLKKATRDSRPVPLEAAALAKEVRSLKEILELLQKPPLEQSNCGVQTDVSPPTYVHNSTSPRPGLLRFDAGVSSNRPSLSLHRSSHAHQVQAPPRLVDSTTSPTAASRREAVAQTASVRLLDRLTQTETRRICEGCRFRDERRAALTTTTSVRHEVNFGTSPELLEARRGLFAAKQSLKKTEDERNKLALELEDKKHKISVISRRAKLLNDELKSQHAKHRDKENLLKDEVDKLSRNIELLKAKAKAKTATTTPSRASHHLQALRRHSASAESTLAQTARPESSSSGLPTPRDFPHAAAFRKSLGRSVEFPPQRPQPGGVFAPSPERPSSGRSGGESLVWQRVLGHLSEPEMATIRRSVEFVGLEGVREVISSSLSILD